MRPYHLRHRFDEISALAEEKKAFLSINELFVGLPMPIGTGGGPVVAAAVDGAAVTGPGGGAQPESASARLRFQRRWHRRAARGRRRNSAVR
jgi:hypothetical protein